MNLDAIILDNIPATLRKPANWVFWKHDIRNGSPTKVPYKVNGERAESDDSSTWSAFDVVSLKWRLGMTGMEGIGFMFDTKDGVCGIDLDGCRDPETGIVADWAREIILDFNTYSEVSPSKTGVKMFGLGRIPFDTGKNLKLPQLGSMGGKAAGIELYDHKRYFATTGWRLSGLPLEPQPCSEQLAALKERFWAEKKKPPPPAPSFTSESAVVDRARKYLAKVPYAVSGQGGHNATFYAACILVRGFGLPDNVAMALLQEWNQGCQPPWSERELKHKIDDASKATGPINQLRNARPEQLDAVASKLNYGNAPPPKPEPTVITLKQAADARIQKIRHGTDHLLSLGFGPLEYALSGGVEKGELIIMAARPSHGKSAVALQCVHKWTEQNLPCMFVSEEMSPLLLGKRAIQFASEIDQDYWKQNVDYIQQEMEQFFEGRENCYIVEGCGTIEAVCEIVERYVAEHEVKCVVLDYVQLLTTEDKTKRTTHEQLRHVSMKLKDLKKKTGVVLLVLAQLSRKIEERDQFIPVMSDLGDCGQLERDADVILGLVYPYKVDPKQFDAKQYQFFVIKNRNRETKRPVVDAEFDAAYQKIAEIYVPPPPRHEEFDEFAQ